MTKQIRYPTDSDQEGTGRVHFEREKEWQASIADNPNNMSIIMGIIIMGIITDISIMIFIHIRRIERMRQSPILIRITDA